MVRTTVLARNFLGSGGGAVTLLTVPDGQTWLAKEADLVNLNAGPATVSVFAQNPAATIYGNAFRGPIAAGAHGDWKGFLALLPGDQLVLSADVGPVHVWVTGAKLVGVA